MNSDQHGAGTAPSLAGDDAERLRAKADQSKVADGATVLDFALCALEKGDLTSQAIRDHFGISERIFLLIVSYKLSHSLGSKDVGSYHQLRQWCADRLAPAHP